ncbi:transglycosylase domain-containing protein [Natranaerofaba carboxydovora]|uniref:transglycosylase domain-containing protein n=1 Tax=Natranaerofaba carboxydovora TaxID=2742683 RepID=UPI001F148B83|nr:PBP1A family penicillin-binding protein [Natranaerofaba carboxydovora]UMZ75137.1 Penicillin-binding protein 2D [Natranaerofaba carboxydovora]
MFLLLVFLIFVLIFFLSVFYLPIVVKAIEEDPIPDQKTAVTLLDKDGNEFYKDYSDYRIKKSIDEIPNEVIQALISVEDERFYDHYGIDFRGVARAALTNISERRIVEGGSTITQQLAKNYFLSQDRTFARKINEVAYTIFLERNLTKQEIIERYLNKVYFGHGAYGIEAASRLYFDKNVSDITLSEKAMLIGLIRSPYGYSPHNDISAAKRRRNVVLSKMYDNGFIGAEEVTEAMNDDIELAEISRGKSEFPYFANQVIRELREIKGNKGKSIHENGLVVHTTLDRELQKEAKSIMQNDLPVQRYLEVDETRLAQPQGSLVALEPDTGFVRTLVGGRSFEKSELNRANLKNGREMGSVFKPFVYATALEEKHYHPATMITCEETEFKLDGNSDEVYTPTCFGGGYHDEDFTLRRALTKSCNVAAVTINKEINPKNSVRYAKKLGIESDLSPWLSLPMGAFGVSLYEVTASYAPFANHGVRTAPTLIKEVENFKNETVYQDENSREVVLDERIAYQLTNMLKDVISPEGTASSIYQNVSFDAAGKTGTSQDGRDAAFVGYTPELVVGVHIGDDKNEVLQGTGGGLAAPLWARFMNRADEKYEFGNFDKPDGMVAKDICQESGNIASTNCPDDHVKEEHFLPNKVSREICDEHFDIPGLHWGVW